MGSLPTNGLTAGLVGNNAGTISESYAGAVTFCCGATGQTRGLVAWNAGGTIDKSYWDAELGGQSTGIGGTNGLVNNVFGLSTNQARTQTTYTTDPITGSNWDFANVWGISPSLNNGHPFLQSQLDVSSTQLGKYIFEAISQLNPSPSNYGTLDPKSIDPSSHLLVETETCVATSYTMIARAAGDAGATIGDFYNAGSDPSKPHGADPTKLGPLGVVLSPEHFGFGASIVNLLNSGHPVLLGGTFSANAKGIGLHWMLGVGTVSLSGKTLILAHDPWTGTKVAVDPKAALISQIMDPVTGTFYLLSDVMAGTKLAPSIMADFNSLPLNPTTGALSYRSLPSFKGHAFVQVTMPP
jgi:hypothetical protein